jgi:anti-sigma B factor antagonist
MLTDHGAAWRAPDAYLMTISQEAEDNLFTVSSEYGTVARVASERRVFAECRRQFAASLGSGRRFLMSFATPQSAGSGGLEELAGVETGRSSPDGGRRVGSARAVGEARPERFGVEVQRRDDVAIVRPRGELDVATVEALRAALDGIESAGRLVLDLRGLSFIDSTGLHLLMALHQRAQRDGFELSLLAPEAPVDRAIQLSGLDEALPFVSAGGAIDGKPGESTSGPQGRR